MSDPFSVAGSTVGVISLGLQVCNQLISYCQSVQNIDQDLKNIEAKAKGLRVPLKTLRDILEDNEYTDPDLILDMKEKVQAIVAAIERLRLKVAKYRPADCPTGINEKVRAQYKKAVYPLRKDSLRDMMKDLDDIQMNLHTSLHVYSAQNVRLIPLFLEMQKETRHEIQEMSLLLRTQTIRPLDCKSESTRSMQTGEEGLSSTNTTTAGSSTYISGHDRAQALALPHPRNSKDLDIAYGQKYKYRSKRVTKRYNYCSRMLGLFISTSISFTKGAGGLSIALMLRFYALSPPESPIFTLLKFDGEFKMLRSDSGFNGLISGIQQLFQEGKATPFDVNPTGESLVALVSNWARYRGVYDKPDLYNRLIELIKFLVEQGSPVHLVPHHGQTPIDHILLGRPLHTAMNKFQNGTELIRYLIRNGCHATSLDFLHVPMVRKGLRFALDFDEDAVLIPEIVKAIIRRSEPEFKSILKSAHVRGQDTFQGRPLVELLVGWPNGLQILLNIKGADINPAFLASINIVFWCIAADCYQSLEIILRAGCPVRVEDLYRSAPVSKSRILNRLLHQFVSSRMKLKDLATLFLSPKEFPELNRGPHIVPDAAAGSLLGALRMRGVRVDSGIQVESPGHSVYSFPVPWYRMPTVPVPFLDQMYNAGLHDVDVPDRSGRTPLMLYFGWSLKGLVDRLCWLVSKRASIFRPLPGSTASTLHALGAQIVEASIRFQSPVDLFDELPPKRNRIVYYIINAPVEDGCSCGCCLSGCTPRSMALRQVLMRQAPIGASKNTLKFVLPRTKRTPDNNRSVIRLLTFDALGLKHTCCHMEGGLHGRVTIRDRDREEVAEIRDEEGPLLADFEKLLAELQTKFNDLDVPLLEFIEGYWHSRVVDYLLHRDPYNEEHARGMRRLGVRLEPEQDAFPERLSLMLGAKVQEVGESDSDDLDSSDDEERDDNNDDE